jgi:DNA-binding XRE family transcriptional regulator
MNYSQLLKTRKVDTQALEKEYQAQVADQAKYKLKELRKAQGFSQQSLAKKLRVSQNAISELENRELHKAKIQTITSYVQMLGGTTRITADFGKNGSITLVN